MPGTEDILGHGAILDRLWSALRRDALHHAYLFEGPAGVGKRLVAVRLAMAANCTGGGQPCGACPTCVQIAAGAHPDVITLSPDPERATPVIPVDDIREVVRKTAYHRYNSRRRFVIVDPAEAMGDGAANALLKTLEEPPAGTGFVLVATHASALLPTIVSRCQRVRFAAVPEDELAPWLASRGVADAGRVARLAGGAPGRALTLGEGGLAERLEMRDRLLAAVRAPVGAVLDASQRLAEGTRPQWTARVALLLEVLEDLLRDTAVLASGAGVPLVNDDARDEVTRWAAALWPDGVGRCADAVRDARSSLALNVSGRTLLDALLLRVREELGY